MNISMSGTDWTRAPVALREQISFSEEELVRLMKALCARQGIEGCVILSTCNRTEVYLDAAQPIPHPWLLLCQEAGLSLPEEAFVSRQGESAVRHLLEVASGLHSRIFGEDQIITQIRTAMDRAMETGVSSPLLNLLFRTAVTVGKRVKTQVHLSADRSSASQAAVEALGQVAGLSALVIGNGEVARLAAQALLQRGCQVTMTLRTYRHGENQIPQGCRTVPYSDRIAAASGKELLLSATASPHLTVTREDFAQIAVPPRAVVDLAVPRDVDPAIRTMVPAFWDVDDLGGVQNATQEQLTQANALIDAGVEEVLRWQERRLAREETVHFPLFLDLRGKKVVLVGGGVIACRRIGVLRQFGCDLTVIAPELKLTADWFTWLPRAYQPGDLEGAFLAIAATDSRQVNHAVGQEANEKNILVSVADCMEECSFYFPAICTGNGVVAGVVSDGRSHRRTAIAAKEIRKVLEGLE